MRHLSFGWYSGPLVALGVLVAVVCLAGSWYINRLQAELAETIRHDAAGIDAADNLQVQLRHLRVHCLTLVMDRSDARRAVVQDDLTDVAKALEAIHQTATPRDQHLVQTIEENYAQYEKDLKLDRLPSPNATVKEVALWSDAHHMQDFLETCRALADSKREHMKQSLEQSEDQTAWAGRVLFGLGFTGVLAGLVSGYATARALSIRVARLSIRVQAVQAHLDQEIEAMTVQGPPPNDLDEQLDRMVDRVRTVCHRLQEQERDLLRAEQLAAVGQLAAGVAHEVRNPLTGVKLLLQAAARAEKPTPLTEDRLHLLLQEVARIERTVQGLMDFATASPPARQPQDLREVVEAAVNVAQSRAEIKAITFRVQPFSVRLPVAANRDQLLSVLTNLFFNAIDATPAGGEVAVSMTPGPNHMIQVSVTDTGPGIDRVADKLFTPFATTKPTGTGLGLTVARKIAREHGGTLVAADKPDGGACFTLSLPIVEDSHAETPGR